MHGENGFSQLLIVLFLAFFVPVLLSRIKNIPVVVGEIAAGILFAQLGWLHIDQSSILNIFSDIGLAFLMFLAGLEIDFNRLVGPASAGRPDRKRLSIPLLAVLVYAITLGLAEAGAAVLGWAGMEGNAHLLAFILSATSLGVLLPILKERHMMQSPGGQALFFVAVIADFATVILLTIFIILQENGLSLEILSIVLIFVIALLFARIGIRFIRAESVKRVVNELSNATTQFKVRASLTIMLAFVVMVETLGAELILGAFLAGMIISLFKTSDDDDLIHKLEAFGFGFFIPVFFISTGASLNLSALFASPETILLFPLILFISVVVKLVPTIVMRKVLSWREVLAGGLLLNTHLSLEVAVAVIGQRLGLLSSATSTAIILFAIITVLLMPLLFNLIQPPAEKEGRRQHLVFGWNNPVTRNIARELHSYGDPISILVTRNEDVENVQAQGYPAVTGNDEQPDIPVSFPVQQIQSFLAFSNDDNRNYSVCRSAREAGVDSVIALVNQPENLPKFRELGVEVFMPNLYQSKIVALMARNTAFFNLMISHDDKRDVREFILHNHEVAGKQLREIKLPGNTLILSIVRQDQVVIAHGSTRLNQGDQLVVLGETDALNDIEQMLTR